MTHEPSRRLFVLPPYLPTPPQGYGGIEAVAAALLPAWYEANADITVCSPEGTDVKATAVHELCQPLYPIISRPYNFVTTQVETYIARVLDLAWNGGFDVIHDFTGMPAVLTALAAASRCQTFPPILHTLHGPIGPESSQYLLTIVRDYPRVRFTAISFDQLTGAPTELRRRTEVVHNGVDVENYPFGLGNGPLLCMGRICEDKGQDRLVSHCHRYGISLDLAGTVAEMTSADQIMREVELGDASAYSGNPDFQLFRRMQPHLGKTVRFHGNVGGEQKLRLLGNARALVVPNRWREPFGMVAIEAMACGTPVIAMSQGAMGEIVNHCYTGFLADSFQELCNFLRPEYLGCINRQTCRRHVERHFGASKLAYHYLRLQDELVAAADHTVV